MSKLFLLSIDEAKKIPQNILAYGIWWWLRSPGDGTNVAAGVDGYGRVHKNGDFVNYVRACVRPAVHIKAGLFDTLDRTKKGYVKLGTKPNGKPIEWIDISVYIGRPYLLIKKSIEQHRFDENLNNYDKSDIKARLAELDNILFTDYEKSFIEDWGE